MQRTDFPVEILVFDDASSDSTQEIIRGYAAKHAHIRTFLQTENQWQHKKYGLVDWLFPNARGRYVALCEGDDYWTDPHKLQKQVDFMEANPSYALTYHRVDVVNLGKTDLILANQLIEKNYSFEFLDSLQGKHGATLSMFFRSEVTKKIAIDFDSEIAVGDWPLECLCTLLGKGFFFNESMGVYRVHSQGVTKALRKSDFFNTRIALGEKLLQLTVSESHRPLLKKFLFRVNILKFVYYLKRRQFKTAAKALMASVPYHYSACLRDDPNWENNFRIKEPLRKLLRSFAKRVSPSPAMGR